MTEKRAALLFSPCPSIRSVYVMSNSPMDRWQPKLSSFIEKHGALLAGIDKLQKQLETLFLPAVFSFAVHYFKLTY